MLLGAERESCESEDHEPNSPALVLGHRRHPGRHPLTSHGRQSSTASASRDSGLTMSNPQLYDEDDDLAAASGERTLERGDGGAAAAAAVGGTTAGVTQGGPSGSGSLQPLHKSTTISDDSVLGSPNDFSAENSEQVI